MPVYLCRRPLLLCSVVHTNIPLRLPLRNVIRKSSIHRRSTGQAYLWSQPKLEKGRGRDCCSGAVLWPPLYLWSRAKLEKGRGAGCGGGAVRWPPLYLWSRTKLVRCTVAVVVPLVPDKAREGAWGWLLLRRQCCTVAAAVAPYERFRTITMTTTVLRRGARDIIAGAACLLRRRQCCTVAAAVVSHERFRTITMTTTVLLRRTRDIIAGAAATTAV